MKLKVSYENLKKLIDYAKTNPKLIKIYSMGKLLKLNYTTHCMYKGVWNEYTTFSRGIIIDSDTYELIANPFPKFFNEFEYKNKNIRIPYELPYWITEKLDGVLIIPFNYKNKLYFSSRGSFNNEYIEKAEKIAPFDELPEKFTFMLDYLATFTCPAKRYFL